MTTLTRLCVRVLGLLTYAVVACAGGLTLMAPPPSVEKLGLYGALGATWSLMLMGGGACGFIGLLLNRIVGESTGSFFCAGGFLVWAVAVFSLPHPTTATTAVALVFTASSATAARHGFMAVSGVNPRGDL